MKDKDKTKKQLIDELAELRKQINKLETIHKKVEKKLKTASDEWRTTFDSANELIMLLDSKD